MTDEVADEVGQAQGLEAQVQVEAEATVKVEDQASRVEEQMNKEAQVPVSYINAPPIKFKETEESSTPPIGIETPSSSFFDLGSYVNPVLLLFHLFSA